MTANLNVPPTALYLYRAALCADCDHLFRLDRGECPCCGSRTFAPLTRFMAGGVYASPDAAQETAKPRRDRPDRVWPARDGAPDPGWEPARG